MDVNVDRLVTLGRN